jgi:hypothetical protein
MIEHLLKPPLLLLPPFYILPDRRGQKLLARVLIDNGLTDLLLKDLIVEFEEVQLLALPAVRDGFEGLEA